MAPVASPISPRWYPLRYHEGQSAFWRSRARFKIVAAGRRSGKTELAKRWLVKKALECKRSDGRFCFLAPTRPQAKSIFWKDLKELVPRHLRLCEPSETELCVQLLHGPCIYVLSLDMPARIEGVPWDAIVIDEFPDAPADSWPEHVRPTLSTVDRLGEAVICGVPQGRDHFYTLWTDSVNDDDYDRFTWWSSTVIGDVEDSKARRELDEDSYNQEYRASWVSYKGRVYRYFSEATHVRPCRNLYSMDRPLYLALDFNVEPGSGAVLQDHPDPFGVGPGTLVLDELHIPRDSDTRLITRQFCERWGGHSGNVYVFGDATGRSRDTRNFSTTDWSIVKSELSNHFSDIFFRVPRANPRQVDRVLSVNSRLMSADKKIRLWVDPRCKQVIMDFDGVKWRPGVREIDKKDHLRTHWSDEIGYCLAYVHPAGKEGRSGVAKKYLDITA